MKYKKIIYIILSFLIPFTFIFIVFNLNGFFSSNAIINSDMASQTYPLFHYLKDLLNGMTTLFYSFNKSMGGTMFGTFFYYLSSPLNLLLYFVNKSDIINFITILIVIKFSLCSLTMYIYLRRKFKEDSFLLLALSIAYGLMGYNLNYFIVIQWLDIVFLAPLVLIGIDKIIEGESFLFYMILLFISIFSNYYLSYMLCIFCVLYFAYELLIKYDLKKDKAKLRKIIFRFLFSSLLSGLMCSFFLIPCVIESFNYGRNVNLEDILSFDFNYFNLFSKTYIGTTNIMIPLNYSCINIYISIVILPLVFFYFMNRNINNKERNISLIFLTILILPLFIGFFNYIWHLFTNPIGFNYRYSYLLCIFLIIISYKSVKNLNISRAQMLAYLSLYLTISFLSLITIYFANYYYLSIEKIWITVIFLFIYFFLLYKSNKTKLKFLSLFIICEVFLNFIITFSNNNASDIDKVNSFYEINNDIVDKYYDKNYRMSVSTSLLMSYNDQFIFNYSGLSGFLSTTNSNYLKFLYNSSFVEYIDLNYYVDSFDSYLKDSLLGNKIIVSKQKIDKYKLIDEFTFNNNKYYLYDNQYALNIGYMVNEKLKDKNLADNTIDWNNNLFNSLTNNSYIYVHEIPYKYRKNDEYKYDINNSSDNLIFIQDHISNDIIFNDNPIGNMEVNCKGSLNLRCIIENDYKNQELTIKLNNNNKADNFKLYYLDFDSFKKVYDVLSKNQFNIEEKKDNFLKGNINVTSDKKVFLLTLAYEKGFNIYVDGVKTEYYDLYGFIGVDLDEGYHVIEITYSQPGLKLGIIFSCCAFVISFAYLIIDNKHIKKEKIKVS